jgi:anti-anti-sigma factor
MAETTVKVTDDAATVALSGEFDMAGTFTIEPALERVLQMPGLERVTLDLSAVTFIDWVGLGTAASTPGRSRAAKYMALSHDAACRQRQGLVKRS